MTRRTATRALLAIPLAIALSLPLAGCGDAGPASDPAASAASSDARSDSPSGAQPTTACATVAPTAAPPVGVSTDLAQAPQVPPSDDPPPCDLVISDVVVGTGPAAVAGSTAAVKYVGAFYETGEEFDSSWSRSADETLPVTLGEGRVIPGFEQAVTGMSVGGRRMATIPSDLAYGPQGQGPIPGGATLVFVLDLVSVSP